MIFLSGLIIQVVTC